MRKKPTVTALKKLEENVRGMNFVYVVGYSLEKVHSGVLAALLNSHYGVELAAALWNKVCAKQPLSAKTITDVRAKREKKIGQRTVVDLIVTSKDAVGGKAHHVICEYKVDGTEKYLDQCKRIRNAWLERNPGTKDDSCFVLATMGGARFWDLPDNYRRLDIPDILDILKKHQDVPLVAQYTSALKDERLRGEIAADIADMGNVQHLGYRDYDWWYAYYDALRNEFAERGDWRIYSGGHNPVLCWQPAWSSNKPNAKNFCAFGRIFCEFNRGEFRLKIEWNDNKDTESFYAAVEEAWENLAELGFHRTRRNWHPKQYSSVGKKDFSEDLRNIQRIVDWVDDFIANRFFAFCQAFREATPRR